MSTKKLAKKPVISSTPILKLSEHALDCLDKSIARDYWSIPKAFRSHAEREALVDSLGKAQVANDDAIQSARAKLDHLLEDGKVIAARLVLAGVTPVRKGQKAEA